MTLLSQAGALNSGHDLWVFPQYKGSFWTSKIDWMINFQILKNLRHHRQNIVPELNNILEANEIKSFPYSYDQELFLMPPRSTYNNVLPTTRKKIDSAR